MTKLTLSLILLTASLLFSCSDNKEATPVDESKLHILHETVVVEAVYFHEKNKYTVASIEDKELKMISLPHYGHQNLKPRIFIDVPAGEKSWYEVKYERKSKNSNLRKTHFNDNVNNYEVKPFIHIHISSIDQLNTADWNNGKFGSGKTTRIN
jgi:hypothetical protein